MKNLLLLSFVFSHLCAMPGSVESDSSRSSSGLYVTAPESTVSPSTTANTMVTPSIQSATESSGFPPFDIGNSEQATQEPDTASNDSSNSSKSALYTNSETSSKRSLYTNSKTISEAGSTYIATAAKKYRSHHLTPTGVKRLERLHNRETEDRADVVEDRFSEIIYLFQDMENDEREYADQDEQNQFDQFTAFQSHLLTIHVALHQLQQDEIRTRSMHDHDDNLSREELADRMNLIHEAHLANQHIALYYEQLKNYLAIEKEQKIAMFGGLADKNDSNIVHKSNELTDGHFGNYETAARRFIQKEQNEIWVKLAEALNMNYQLQHQTITNKLIQQLMAKDVQNQAKISSLEKENAAQTALIEEIRPRMRENIYIQTKDGSAYILVEKGTKMPSVLQYWFKGAFGEHKIIHNSKELCASDIKHENINISVLTKITQREYVPLCFKKTDRSMVEISIYEPSPDSMKFSISYRYIYYLHGISYNNGPYNPNFESTN
ncbi:hypothetical protein [Candidatus Cytomitobacter primus]|uniref:Uncharacterized protein n=1 Tax=Candidatus Cytomitobacter primus TaxID=2066024 RepID=A0A5C0UGH4_9PROT|nr:hypothetical protein [Candidatus Cytomitobacter primus]QEK38392.1 hypothetical protein FZC34_00455 [Candidatus Cytomitobacter primus]